MTKTIRKILNDLECELEIPERIAELSVLLTDDEQIHELNRDYRGKDKPTDVLSFSQLEADEEDQVATVLGDIVISVDTAKRQAKERELRTGEEILRLLVHGLLHLLGYEHEGVPREEAEIMRRKEDELFFQYREDALREWELR